MTTKQKSKDIKDDTSTLTLQPYFIPIAIIFFGSLSALIIFFAFKYKNIDIIDSLDTIEIPPLQETTVSIDDDPYLGNITKAKYAIVEFSDFECPVCQYFHNNDYGDIINEFIDTNEAIFVYRDFPLSFHEPKASEASYAAECVNDLEGTNAYFNFVQNYYYSTQANGEGLPEDITFETLANKIGVSDIAGFNKCVEEARFATEVTKDIKDGTAAGVTGTPNIIIGILNDDGTVDGVLYPGVLTARTLQEVIDEYLD